ncbi:MAG: helix-turn-helix transcriptional regulator [Epsilonproteobacteria bacterium]|nr:helix-turn-helix transcriptional regulator [Campylobacterota bacterium]
MISTKLRIKELLRQRRWTTKILAEKTGMSESYLTHIKNGTRRWNEDALKKLAVAFELEPIDMFDYAKNRTDQPGSTLQLPEEITAAVSTGKLRVVPVLSSIPEQPSDYNNQVAQASSSSSTKFVPVMSAEHQEQGMFCLEVDNADMMPTFNKGDMLVIAPNEWTNSGDIVAVEYGNENPVREIRQVNFMDDFLMLESVNHKTSPIALVRGKDNFRIIGKVIFRYQKMA